ncbi:hypothetical protein FACS189462_2260 [Spirochaetia bacterium]|nr:hypothetical protein FACS189462_2260 [Spirochaetia bacterium]
MAHLKPLDFVVIGLSLALTAFSAFVIYGRPEAAGQVTIQGSGGVWVFPLDAEETLTVPGPLGDTVVEIRDHRARVLSSPCDNQTCVAAGHIDTNGEWAACLPNKVFVVIEGAYDDNGTVDTAAW